MSEFDKKAIAIVGVGAVMPDASTPQSFWDNLKRGKNSITEVPHERWDPALYYDPDPKVPNKTYSKIGAWVKDFSFNPIKLGIPIPPKVIDAMDPAQQWAIDASHQALSDYGYPDRPLNPEKVAVIFGNALAGEYHYHTSLRIRTPLYLKALSTVPEFSTLPPAVQEALLQGLQSKMDELIPDITEDTMPGELSNVIAGRVANVFNLAGPNYVTDAACASSFAAMQSAMLGLQMGHFDAALTGGIDRNMGVEGYVKFSKIGALSPDGSRPYAEGANGFVMGEGAGVFLLKRLADAERDGDRIYAVIRGIGGSSDGKGKGITAPNPLGQQRAIERAWLDAGLSPAEATYIEGHGTSTRVGDVAEVESMERVYAPFSLRGERVALGSVKSNVGHLKSAAGAAGLLKVLGGFTTGVIPPNINFERPNPNINFGNIPFYVTREARPWERPQNGLRRAGISSFGFGGTNFHVVLEEYMPGLLTSTSKTFPAASYQPAVKEAEETQAVTFLPPRGLLFIGESSEAALEEKLQQILQDAKRGTLPPSGHPSKSDLRHQERLALDYEDAEDLVKKLEKTQRVIASGKKSAWRMLSAQGIFRGSGAPGKIAFMFPGQGSQYANMLKELADLYPVVADTYREADEVMEPIFETRKLTDYIFCDEDAESIKKAEEALKDTTITQPAMLTADVAVMRLLNAFGFKPDYLIGHSLGEYAALVYAGVLSFQDALKVVSARGKEMSKVSLDDNGCMAAVSAPIEKVEGILESIEGYVVIANINSPSQSVIAGNTQPVEEAVSRCKAAGYEAVIIPVSHAFHTKVVAPANEPLRRVIEKMNVQPPKLPIISNVTGEVYPNTREEIIDIMARQLASPVQFVKSMQTLYNEGVRIFVESGPKRVASALANDNLKAYDDVTILYTNHPRKGALPALNEAFCALYAAGVAPEVSLEKAAEKPQTPEPFSPVRETAQRTLMASDGRLPLTGSVVISGAGLGLPGQKGHVFDDSNVERILKGDIFIEPLPEIQREKMLEKRVTRLIKRESGAEMVLIDDIERTIKLAGQRGEFDLAEEFGVSAARIEALDISTQLAIAAGVEALYDAGIPLAMRYRLTSKGTYLPDRWMLPESLRDETGVIFGSAFPGLDRMSEETDRYYSYRNVKEQLDLLRQVRAGVASSQVDVIADLEKRMNMLQQQLDEMNYHFDRRFIFRVLNMGHSQFAEYIGARGPNTAVNAACATTTHAVAIAEDWIRSGRCRRVIVVAGDDVTSGPLTEWVGTGLLASGATTTEGELTKAVLPFDRRRNGMIMGMGAAALVVESEDAVRERGMRAICEVLGTQIANSAFHGTRLDVDHVSQVMENLVSQAEQRFDIKREQIADKTMFMSHETYTPARGGSAAAEIHALRNIFGARANQVVISNTKGFTGHTMGVGVEDVVATKALENGIVPPIANITNGFEPDPELGDLRLSKGGKYPLEYALRLGAGFGSQIAMLLLRKIPGEGERVREQVYNGWLSRISGYSAVELEYVKRTLRIKDVGQPEQKPAGSQWKLGHGPTQWAAAQEMEEAVMQAAPAAAETADREPQPAGAEVQAPDSRKVDVQAIETYILELVSEKTGYPQEMLDKELDLEGDLGVDTVKQAELFATVRDKYQIPRRDDLRLSDYNTLEKIVAYVRDSTGAEAQAASLSPASEAVQEQPQGFDEHEIKSHLLNLVCEKTGYPVEMLDLDLDLEADLGVDTVKQAELFAEVREHYQIPRRDDIQLADYNSLAKVIDFVKDSLCEDAVGAAAQMTAEPQPIPASMAGLPGVDEEEIKSTLLQKVSEKTGYPVEMLELDLDLEADLGVDTVKQAELFAEVREHYQIPRRDDIQLADYNSLAKVIDFVKDSLREDAVGAAAQMTAEPQPIPASMAGLPGVDEEEIKSTLLQKVSEKTGYPVEMLELDLDLEADLGVDTVKQAELFAEVREDYQIPRRDDVQLADYNTLAKVIGYVKDSLMEGVDEPDSAQFAETQAETPAIASLTGVDEEEVKTTLLQMVSEKTGYPIEMLELDLDLEGDLGVDTVKQAELFSQVREQYDIPRRDDLSLADYNTLAKVIEFVLVSTAPSALEEEQPAEPEGPVDSGAEEELASGLKEIESVVLGMVSEKTGYPEDMLDLELDLEADLGIDTVKQAELLAMIREKYEIQRRDDLRLSDYNTLAKVIDFVDDSFREKNAPALPKEVAEELPVELEPEAEPAPTPVESAQASQPAAEAPPIIRRIPVPVLRPKLSLCKPTQLQLEAGQRFVIVTDQGKTADSLARRLRAKKVELLVLDPAKEPLEKLQQWQADGPVHAVYFLPALDVEPDIEALEEAGWQRELDHRVGLLYRLMRAIGGNPVLISATRFGGFHGYTAQGASAPLGGAVSGFTKAYAWEHRGTLVKVIDFSPDDDDREIAAHLIEESLFDPGAVEIGWEGEQRFAISLLAQELPAEAAVPLEKGSVFLVTGGAGGITVPIVNDLAAHSQGTFYLTGRTAMPDLDDPDLEKVVQDPGGLKKDLVKRMSAGGGKVTPAMVEKQFAKLERAASIREVLDAVERQGATGHYVPCDVTDGKAVEKLVADILSKEGRLDVVIHAAGVEKSHLLEQKTPEEFDLVFSVKTDGYFNLIKGFLRSGSMPKAVVAFSSVAGRLGNAGQTDYSAANDLLNKLSLSLAQAYPQTQFVSIDWGAWAEVGMASRGSLPQIMKRAGIDMIAPDQAAKYVRYELQNGGSGEVLVAGALGIMEKGRDRQGGLDLEKANHALIKGEPAHVMLSRLTGYDLYKGIRLEVKLDPKEEPFLYDHMVNGIAVLPGVMGIEGFSIAAQHIASVLGSSKQGYHVAGLEDVHFQAALKFYKDEPRNLIWRAQVYRLDDDLVAYVTLESNSTRLNHQNELVEHFRGTVYLEPVEVQKAVVTVDPPGWKGENTVSREDIYRLYFHGPAFQVLEGVERDGTVLIGKLSEKLLPITAHEQKMLSAPLLIELCMQTAGVQEIGAKGVMSLPSSIDKVEIYKLGMNGDKIFAEVYPAAKPDCGGFDARVVDDKGNMYVKLTNYCTAKTNGPVEEELIQPLRKLVAQQE